MPVQKFGTIEEMNRAPALQGPRSDFDRFLRHCARYWAIAPKTYPRGVFKFRTIEEAQRAREHHASVNGSTCAAAIADRESTDSATVERWGDSRFGESIR